jgi:hypothetical protein
MPTSRRLPGLILLCEAALVGQYDRLPTFSELSRHQQRLAHGLAPPWNALNDDGKATFYQITYVLERTPVGGSALIDFVTRIEGVLSGDRATHRHSNGTTATVDGWRVHAELRSVALPDLLRHCFGVCSDPPPPCQCRKDDVVVSTHTAFGFTESVRDYRETNRYKGPFLQIVLSPAHEAADLDLDKGRCLHRSSPRDVYERLIVRFPEIQRYYQIAGAP